MPEPNGQDSFQQRVNVILDELMLAIKWGRPSLITAVFRSEHIKNRIQSRLSRSLEESGQDVLCYRVDTAHYDIPLDLMDYPGHEKAVFFICGLQWGGGRGYSNALRALNMHREYLVDGKIKAVFWMTGKEAKQSARFSPDFWAFRHLVVEFLDLPPAEQVRAVPGMTQLQDLYIDRGDDLQARVENAEKLYALGCFEEALQLFHQAARKYPREKVIYLQMAEIHLAMGHLPSARRMLNRAGKGKNENVHFLKEYYNLSQRLKSCQLPPGGISQPTKRIDYDPIPLG